MPLSNTVEFQWNNHLIRKRSKVFDPYIDGRYLKDNFDYSNIAFFEVSQGLDLTVHSDRFVDRLTRLYINTGLTLDKTTFSLEEFYFHRTSEHKLSSSATYNMDRASIAGSFTFNSFNSSNTPIAKLAGYNLTLRASDLVTLKTTADYDLEAKAFNQSTYSIMYAPLNNCWKLEFTYAKDQIERKFGLLIYINYNENNFASLNVR